jgi:hypothetical protein
MLIGAPSMWVHVQFISHLLPNPCCAGPHVIPLSHPLLHFLLSPSQQRSLPLVQWYLDNLAHQDPVLAWI